VQAHQRVPGPQANRLLGALPKNDFNRILPELELVALGTKEPLYDIGQPIETVYFPLSAVLSILTSVGDDEYVEVATVGSEGMVGLPVFLGLSTSQNKCVSQVPGYSARMKSDVFHNLANQSAALHQLMYRYTEALFDQISQGAACNRHHDTTQRLARWLLQTQDRAGADTFPLTQEFIADMLGVRRATASEAEQQLQEAGLIRYQRGIITIVNRKGLEKAACICYRIISDDFDQLIPRNPTAEEDTA
jgi:CRP-like cAMP-binding protein